MNKIIITMISIIVIAAAVITAVMIFEPEKEETENIQSIGVAEDKILDECTDEYEQLNEEGIVETDFSDEKISPNCSMITKKYYTECKHTTKEYSNISSNLINKTKEQVKEIYNDWEIEKFASNELVLLKEFEGTCGEHYMVRDKEGQVVVYQINDDGKEIELQKTNIATDYLTETDRIDMHNGIKVYGKENLNQLIEDFE